MKNRMNHFKEPCLSAAGAVTERRGKVTFETTCKRVQKAASRFDVTTVTTKAADRGKIPFETTCSRVQRTASRFDVTAVTTKAAELPKR